SRSPPTSVSVLHVAPWSPRNRSTAAASTVWRPTRYTEGSRTMCSGRAVTASVELMGAILRGDVRCVRGNLALLREPPHLVANHGHHAIDLLVARVEVRREPQPHVGPEVEQHVTCEQRLAGG